MKGSSEKKHRKPRCWGGGGEDTAKKDEEERNLEGEVSTEYVGELAPEGDKCCGCEVVGCYYPVELG
jgi:hypothetical protein